MLLFIIIDHSARRQEKHEFTIAVNTAIFAACRELHPSPRFCDTAVVIAQRICPLLK